VVHREGESTAGVRALARRLYFADMIAFAARRFGPARAALLAALVAPAQLLQMAAARRRRG
jgi:hypothetical protein